jgi:hypothetical protein
VEGELWLEVDRFSEARDAFLRADDGPLTARAALGLGASLERLADVTGACSAFRRAADGGLAAPAVERAAAGLTRLNCPAG